MTLVLPTVFPVGYAGDNTDFRQAKCDRSGAVRQHTGLVAVPASSLSGTLIGLIPFRAGFKFCYGSALYSAAQGTSVTLSWGYQYYDSTQPNSGTSQTAGFLSASTAAAAGGMMVPLAVTSMDWVAASEGWITALIGGATTTGPANLTFNILGCYDNSGFQPGVTN